MSLYASVGDVRMRGLPEPNPLDGEIMAALYMSKEIIDKWCRQVFIKQNPADVIIDGNGGDRIVFCVKLREIYTLTIDGNSIPMESVVHYIDSSIGEIGLKDGYRFNRGKKNVVLNCSTGFEAVPFAIGEASAHITALILTKQYFAGKPFIIENKAEHLLDYSKTSFDASDIEGFIEQDTYLLGLLKPYRIKGDGV
ncbi:hypothetical protein J7L05_10165 [bacterium]|nr:hypothetical protein [bacterium]